MPCALTLLSCAMRRYSAGSEAHILWGAGLPCALTLHVP